MREMKWTTYNVADLFNFIGNNTCSRAELSMNGKVRNIHYGDVLVLYDHVVDVQNANLPFLDGAETARHPLQNGDVIIADTAEDEIVGKAVEVIGITNQTPTESGLHTMVLRPRRSFAPRFLGYYFNSSEYHSSLRPFMRGTKVLSLSKKDVASSCIRIPDEVIEQQHIAAALTDVDELISAAEKLLDKKRGIKQGAMDELLTCRRRLPSFNKPWKDTTIGTLSSIVTGATPSTAINSYWIGGTIPWMNSGEINLKHVKAVEGRITQLGYNSTSTHLVPPMSVLIALAGQGKTRGTCAITHIELCTNQSIAAILPNDDYDSFFLYYLLDSKYIQLRKASSGDSSRGGLTKKQLSTFSITLPCDIDEQREVAKVLADMDAEIADLEATLRKYEALKQGMMEQLLTGKIRLI